ncbi:hypothetical protein ScPMuIL_001723, partial [Solemya velum]
NQEYIGPYPSSHYYGVDYMGAKEREAFLDWHGGLQGQIFDFRREILEYCRSDVDILRKACLKFRNLLRKATGRYEEVVNAKGTVEQQIVEAIDPFDYITIASVYNFSKISIQWLQWRSKKEGVVIQHALNVGEKKLPGTRLGMKYVSVWDHEFRDQIKNDPKLRHFIDSLELVDRLEPRDSFFGGRTNASKLYCKTRDGEKIKYVDFTSLYPWVNKYAKYPVGHPEIVTSDFGDLNDYFGIALVKILPPRGLYHPVLPYRSNGKLKFPLCRTCADRENQNPCTCNDEQRAMIGTWCTPEIKAAVRKGYRILKVFEVYNWPLSTQYNKSTGEGGLFTRYINTFLKIKQEASGPPSWIETPEDMHKYTENYFLNEGVHLDPQAIVKNPGLRALAKLCLNSFWGKMGQRLNLKQTQFIHESEVNTFFQLLTDPQKKVENFHIVATDTLLVEWNYRTDCVPDDEKTNIYLATFTTCWARLKLYGILEKLDERVLYYDTDSVIYLSRPGEYEPPLGDYLGELTNELEGDDYITEFVSGGPKNYAYRTNTGKTTCKVRGFSLHFTNMQIINFDTMKTV